MGGGGGGGGGHMVSGYVRHADLVVPTKKGIAGFPNADSYVASRYSKDGRRLAYLMFSTLFLNRFS